MARENVKLAYDGLIARGLSPIAAAASVGNFMQESLRNGDIQPTVSGDNGNAFGIAQWNGPRKKALFAFAQKIGKDPNSIDTQLDFFIRELNTTERRARDALANATTLDEATLALSSKFFRPGDPRDGNRKKFAAGVFRLAEGGRLAQAGAAPPEAADRILGSQGAQAKRVAPAGTTPADRILGRDRAEAAETFEAQPPEALNETFGQKAFRVGEGVLNTMADVPLFGMGDEIEAGVRAFRKSTFDSGNRMTLGENFEVELDAAREKRRDFRDRNPGLSLAIELPTAVATGVGAGPTLARGLSKLGIKGAQTGAGRVAQVATAGATAGALEGFGRGEGGLTPRLGSAGVGAAFGGGAAVGLDFALRKGVEVIAPLVRRKLAFKNGQLTAEARAALEAEGITAEQFDAAVRKLAGLDTNEADAIIGNFRRRMARSTDPQESARRTAADEFDIPLTQGQATGGFDDIAFEEAARSGSRGAGAGDIARTAENQQRAAILAAREEGIVPGAGARSPQESAERVQIALGNNRAADKAAVSATYDAIPTGTKVKVEAFQHLPDLMEAAATSQTNVGLFPEAAAAIAAFRKEIARAGDEVNFRALDSIRKIVTRDRSRLIAGATKGDPNAAGALNQLNAAIGAFDDWVDGSVVKALTTTNPLEHDAAITAVKAARKAHAAFRRTYSEAKGQQDAAGRLMERLTNPKLYPDGGITPQEAANFLYGSGEVGARGETARLANKIKSVLGKGSEEFGELKRGVWSAVTGGARQTPLGAQAMASRILDFTKGKGAALAKTMFSADELAKMNRFANVLRLTVPPSRATNPSGTAAAIARTVQDSANAVTTVLGVASGNVAATFATKLLSGMLKSVGRATRARGAFDPKGRIAVSQRVAQGASFGGGLLGGSVAEQGFAQ